MVVHMEIKLVIGVKQIKLKNMKFKVINEKTKEIVERNLTIKEARKSAWSLNTSNKVDYFYISLEKGIELKDIKYLINKYPNDASLGEEIRRLYK